jgi:hypothetical protein
MGLCLDLRINNVFPNTINPTVTHCVGYLGLNCRMICEWLRTWKDMAVACFKVLSLQLPERAGEDHQKSQNNWPLGHSVSQGPLRYEARIVTTHLQCCWSNIREETCPYIEISLMLDSILLLYVSVHLCCSCKGRAGDQPAYSAVDTGWNPREGMNLMKWMLLTLSPLLTVPPYKLYTVHYVLQNVSL